jgi:transcriptional regulator of acetoin/glycerol metabolism
MRALVTARGKRAEVARILGVSRQTVWTWIKKYAIDVKRLLSTDGGGSDGD